MFKVMGGVSAMFKVMARGGGVGASAMFKPMRGVSHVQGDGRGVRGVSHVQGDGVRRSVMLKVMPRRVRGVSHVQGDGRG